MDEQRRIGELEQALRDERVERDAAQQRVGELQERADLWRTRAEERSGRIERLVAERDSLRSAGGWLRAKAGRAIDRPRRPDLASEPPGAGPVRPVIRSRPEIPVVRVAALIEDPHLARVFDEMDRQAIDTRSLADADVVVVDSRALQSSERTLVDAIGEWSRLDARQPLIVLGDADSPLAAVAQVVLAPGEIVTFDPERHNPMRDVPPGDTEGATLDAVAAAASGTPLLRDDTTTLPTAIERDRLGVQARRWAYRKRAPWVIAHRLLDQAGVPHPAPEPRVAGLLVSMRPNDVLQAIARFEGQDYDAKELVVVCHGFDSAPVRSALAAGAVPHQVFEISRDRPLGTCLNAAAEATSANVLAKIDDDDHYGPGFLVDAVDALRYSAAELVGKAAHYTYVQGSDVTVLRRADAEERFVDGSVAGGSMVFRRRIWEDVRFPIRPRRVDTLFLRGARALGARVYANSRWDFVYRRRQADQTWRAADEVFLANTLPAWDGDHPERANA